MNHSDEVLIKELHGDNITIIELSVAREDLGKVIGRNGRTITAIRTILNAAGATQKKRVVSFLNSFLDPEADRDSIGRSQAAFRK